MLASDPKKLRWLGIDLRPRWRRRVAVVVTYVVFVVLNGLVLAMADEWHLNGHRFLGLLAVEAMAVLSMLWLWMSVFRPNGVVKSFDLDPASQGRKYMIVGSLDEWAQYRYGVAGFDDASEEQQKELLRKYKVGNYRVPAIEDYRLDERERAERDRISRWALITLAWTLVIMAGVDAMQRHPFQPLDVGAILWSYAFLALTLPQARVLWTEPNPRDASDLKLAEGEA